MRAIEARLAELRDIPMQIIWGVDDPVFNVEYRDRLMRLFPHAEGPVNFARASHFLQDDRGADIVAAIIPFLARVAKP